MPSRLCLLALPLLTSPVLLAAAPAAHAAAPAPVTITKTTVHIAVTVGPNSDQPCDVEADLYVPSTATPATPQPAILTSNGFGGSKDGTGATGNASYAQSFAQRGYVALSYSGLGFGGSSCQIELDDPDWDGKAGSALVSFLGGDLTHAFTDANHTTTVTTAPPVQLDATDHNGHASSHDPRVGMIGGSYGGQNQLAIAGVDPRVDTIIPQITWNDLAYSLAPNNEDLTTQVRQSLDQPGTEKLDWVSAFFALGFAQPVTSPAGAQPTGSTCPGFDSRACTAKAQMDALGYPDATTTAFAQHASASSYLSSIHIPVFLSQGQADTLFTLREAAATYEVLKRQGTPVKMMWQNWGHSGNPVPGEADATAPLGSTHDDVRYDAWMRRWLRGDTSPATLTAMGPEFEYYADWLPYSGTGPNDSQYVGAPSYPVAGGTPFYLSGTSTTAAGDVPGALVTDPAQVTAGTSTIATSAAATSYSETSAVDQTGPLTDAPGTFADFTTAPLPQAADQVGGASLQVRLSAPSYQAAQSQPGARVVLFAKIYDVAPDGTKVLAHRLVAPVRVAHLEAPVRLALPAVVHRYPAGHRIEVVLAQGDAAYKNTNVPGAVQVVNDPAAPNVLTLPLLASGATTGPAPVVPEAPLAALLPLGGALAAAAVVLRRRARR